MNGEERILAALERIHDVQAQQLALQRQQYELQQQAVENQLRSVQVQSGHVRLSRAVLVVAAVLVAFLVYQLLKLL